MWDLVTSQFSFTALWSPIFMAITIVLAAAYLMVVGPLGKHFSNFAPIPWYKKLSFVAGLAAVYLGFGGPIYLISHLMFSFHMFKMAFVYFVAPPLLLFGTPAWILRPLLQRPLVHKFVKYVMHPFVALFLFNLFVSLYHMPAVFDNLMANYELHIAYQAFLFVAAMLMWWHILTPVPEYDRMSEIKKIAYVFSNGALLIPACALIIFADHTIYATYTDPNLWSTALGYCLPAGTPVSPQLFDMFNLLSPMEDQQLGGVIMKLTQELVFIIVLAHIFYHWVKKEKNVIDIRDFQRRPEYGNK